MDSQSTELEFYGRKIPGATIPQQIITIIGGGFSGSMVLFHLLKNKEKLPKNSQIKIIDDKDQFNKGVAYSTKSEAHILNVPAGNMGATADNPGGFVEWLNKYGHSVKSGDFVQRHLYSEYLSSIISNELKSLNGYLQVDFIHDEVIDIAHISEDEVHLSLKSGDVIKSNQVVIAAGNIPHSIPVALRTIVNSRRYISDPWDISVSKNELLSSKEILIIGTSLTAVDVVLDLESRGYKGNYTMLSRHGYLPLSHLDNHQAPPKIEIIPETFSSVNSALKWIRENSKIYGWIPLFETIRPKLQSFWLKWSEKERNRFKRVVRPHWEIHRHRIPASSHKTIQDLIKSGRIKLIRGNIQKSFDNPSSVAVEVRLRGTNELTTINSEFVFNCTGLKDSSQENNKCLRYSLMKSGAIFIDKTFGAQANVDDDFKIIVDSRSVNNIFLLGALLKSQFGESTAVRELRVQADKVAKSVLASIEQTGLRL